MATTGTDEGDVDAPLDRVLDALEGLVEADRLPLAREFARAMVRRVPAFELEDADPTALATEIADAFRFVDTRSPDELAVRVLNPDLAVDGRRAPGTVVEVSAEDRPFLLSTIDEELRRRGHEIVRRFHPVLGVDRDAQGRLAAISPARHAPVRESIVMLELAEQLDDAERRSLEDSLRGVLEDVLAATRDQPEMRAVVERLTTTLRGHAATGAAGPGAAEVAALLDWLLDDNFLLLGVRDYELVPGDDGPVVRAVPDSGRGILADDSSSQYAEPRRLADADEGMRARYARADLLTVARSHRTSRVHRRARMVNVWVRRVDDDGAVVGESRLLGLFTRKAYAEPSSTIPVLRRKLERFLESEDVVEDSHDERAFVSLFEAVPKEELFELDEDALHSALLDLFAAQESREARLLVRTNELTGTVSAILAVPRDRYDAELRRRVSGLLVERFGGSGIDVDLSLGDRPDAIVRFAIHVEDGAIPPVAVDELEREVAALCRTWDDEIRAALRRAAADAEAPRLRAIAARMPRAYRSHAPAEVALEDLRAIDDLLRSGDELRIRLHDDTASERPLTRVKIAKAGAGVELSEILPVLESLGLTVVEELPFRLEGDGPDVHVHDYGVHDGGRIVDVGRDAARVAEAVVAAWNGDLEVDSLNRLVLRAGLDWGWVSLFRAYRRYRRQVGTAYTAEYQNDALAENPDVARALVDLFAARFEPDVADREAAVTAARRRVVAACDAVERLDHDRILRGFLALVDATLRTNRYAPGGEHHLALKFDSAAVPRAPRPVPFREVFVHSPRMEGIHLRGGPVARGGVRWSDRRDDFRTEVLDLMRAQMLKNAVIVPTGAKGGFVLKRPPADPSELRAEVERRYREFIRALLDVTDDVAGGEVVHPTAVVAADGDDPYLVVAADRGTATFSDVANAIADERGFWLGDAFASGGSRGYDHKALGITARGAWVAVQRHFRELGIDVQHEPFTAVGIGDMSGDVFGNGMLQSRTLRLVAAFDHRDIFLDPDPDPERSHAERRRLADHPELSWRDYDRDTISEGGGVWSRSAKRIVLSKEVRELLRVDAEELSPPEVVRAVLTAPVDLLFAGGIGTFVKASHEAHDEIGDRANDEVRVDATEVRARVVAEGANLALTQRARIQYARRGGRVNTDFIDNSAGVDISDHEVNLKILLRLAIERGALEASERDALLSAVTGDVEAACLRDVDLQTWLLTQEQAGSPRSMDAYGALITHLETAGAVDREVEALPSPEQVEERRAAGAGLTRPELAVLVAAAKRDLIDVVVRSDLADQPALRPALERYFPPLLVERFGDLLDEHRLRRELVATVVANDVVNRMGTTFVHRLSRELGADRARVVAAWWLSREVSGAERYWRAVEDVERAAGPTAALDLEDEADALLEVLTREYLRTDDLTDVASRIARDRPAFEQLERAVGAGPAASRRPDRDLPGIDRDVASCLRSLSDLAIGPDVASVARAADRDVAEVAEAFFAARDALGLERLRRLLDRVEPDDRWARWHLRGLSDDLRAVHRFAAERALTQRHDRRGAAAVEAFLAERRDEVSHANRMARQIEEELDPPRLEALSVALRTVREALRG